MNELTYRIRRFLFQEFIPVTKGVIVSAVAVYLVGLVLSLLGINLDNYLVLSPINFLRFPWTIITYPLVNGGIGGLLSLIFAVLWLWFAGGSLERSWGSGRYGLFLALVTLVTGAVMGLVEWFFPGSAIYGLWLPLVGVTWAWASIIPDQEVMLMGIVPIKLKWLAWLDAVMVFYMYVPNFLLAAASLSGILVVYLFRRSGPYAGSYRYRNSNRGFSAKSDDLRRRARKSKFRIIK